MKSKILLLTTMLASASFAFAQSQTVTYQGITFEILQGTGNVIVTNPGETVTRQISEIIQDGGNSLIINTNKRRTITNQRRQVNVKAVAVNQDIKPGQILNWTDFALAPDLENEEDKTTIFGDFGVIPRRNGGVYAVYTERDAYKKYEKICKQAITDAEKYEIYILKGRDISAADATIDKNGVDIHPDLYYFEDYYKESDGTWTLSYRPITSTQGGIYIETTMNNCYDYYTPIEISNEIAWNVTTSGKVGIVSGVVNNARITEAAEGGARNFDFTNTLVLGKVELDIPANKLAYFPSTRDEEGNNFIANGNNIVTGTKCANYIIKDNGDEIFVNKTFTAENATYERTFKPNSYGTIVLPFAASTDANPVFFEKLSQLTSYDPSTDVLTFTNTYESIAANRPYLYRLQDEAPENIIAINVNVGATPSKVASGTYNGATMYGTFQKLSYAQIQGKFGVSADGEIVNAKEGASLKPGRAYLDLPPFPANSAKTFTIELVDEDGTYEVIEVTPSEATSIEGTISEAKVISTQYIAIDGSVSTTPHKGMNIVKKTLEDGTIQTTKVAF
ncbi:MAG: hypothetical protein Q4E68_09040 [Prevotellaceae bacterium]|nr:hypothetical protein [Prevotellaceae bacterium]